MDLRQTKTKVINCRFYTYRPFRLCNYLIAVHWWPRGRVQDRRLKYHSNSAMPSLQGRLMSTSESCGVNEQTTRNIRSVFMAWQRWLVFGWSLTTRKSAPAYGPLRIYNDFTILFILFATLKSPDFDRYRRDLLVPVLDSWGMT